MPKVIGTAPYQVPTNADLGTMAFQDAAAVSVDLLQVDNIRIDGNTITSIDTDGNITIDPNGTGSITLDSAVTISGNLTVNGTTTTTNSTVVTVDDPVFTLGGDTDAASDDNKDRGIEFKWHNGTSAKLGFFGYDDSAGRFTFIPDATNTSEVFSGTLGGVAFGFGSFNANTSSTSTVTGTVVVTGGVGISENLWAGGYIQVDNLRLDANTLSSTNTNGNITLDPNGTGTVEVVGPLTVSGNTTLGDASTDTVSVNGYMGVGGNGATNVGVYTRNSALTGATQVGIQSEIVGSSAATSNIRSFASFPSTAVASFTNAEMVGFYAGNAAKGAGSTITNQHGLYIADQSQGTNNFGITSLVSSGSDKWNIYSSGTASNYFAGKTTFGHTNTANTGQINVLSTVRVVDASTETNALLTTVTNTTSTVETRYATPLIFGVGAVERFRLSTTEAVFNENSNDYDFRVESDASTHAFFLEASSSNIGISNNAPASRLDVSNSTASLDTMRVQASINGTGKGLVVNANTRTATEAAVAALQVIDRNNATALVATVGGDVGIGTSGPNHALHVWKDNVGSSTTVALWNHDNTNASSHAQLFIESGGASGGDPYIHLQVDGVTSWSVGIDNSDSDYFKISSGSSIGTTDRLTIDTSGRIGISTNAPGEMLDVRGNIRVGGSDAGPNYIAFRGTTGDAPGDYICGYIGERIHTAAEASELFIFKGNDASTSGPDRIRLAASDIVFDTYSTATSGTFETVATSANVTTKAIIKSDGKIGFGTSSPSVLVHIQQITSTTNAVTDVLRLDSQSSGTPAAGIGVGMEFAVETAADNTEIGATIEAVTTDVTAGSEDFDLVFRTMIAGVAPAQVGKLNNSSLQIGANGVNTSLTTLGTADLILNTNAGTNSGSITIFDGANSHINIEPNGTGDIYLTADTVRVGDLNANATITTNGTGDLILNTNFGTNSGSITIFDAANGNIGLQVNGTGTVVVNEAAATADFRVEGNADQNLLFVDGSANFVGIGTNAPSNKLDVVSTTGDILEVSSELTTTGAIDTGPGILLTGHDGTSARNLAAIKAGKENGTSGNYAGYLSFLTRLNGGNLEEEARITSDGRFLLATTSSIAVGSSATAFQQIASTSASVHLSLTNYQNGTDGGILALGKSRGTTVGSYTVVANGDNLGEIRFAGSDGTDLQTVGATIRASVSATPGANDMPTSLVFTTTSDGSSSPSDRVIISHTGVMTVNAGTVINESGSDSDTRIEGDTDVNLVFVDASADMVGIGTNAPTAKLDVVSGSPSTINALQVKSNTKLISPDGTKYMNVRMLDTDTLAFSSSAGQLFSITNSLTGTIFAVNDISGIPSIEVFDSGKVQIAEFTGNVLIGTSSDNGNKLQVVGDSYISGVSYLGGNIVFEGSSVDTNQTTLSIVNPTADRTINLPDANGTVAVSVSDTTTSTQGELNLDFTLSAAGNISATGTAQGLSTSGTPTFASITVTNGAVINNSGNDNDTQIKGLTDDNLIYVDAGNDRVGVGLSTPSVKVHIQQATSTTNAVTDVLRLDSQSTGAPAVGIGVGMEFAVETAAGNTEVGAAIEAVTTAVGSGAEAFDLVFRTMIAGAAVAQVGKLNNSTLQIGADATATTILTQGNSNLTLKTGSTNSGTILINQGANGNIELTPDGTGDVYLNADTVRVGDSAAAATITSNGAGALTVTTGGAANLTLSTNSGTNSGTILINNGANGNIELTPDGTGDVYLNADTVRIGDAGAAVTLTTNGAAPLTINTGAVGATAAGNTIAITGGLGGATSGAGGAVTVQAGSAQTSGGAGALNLYGGAAVGTNQAGADVTIKAGNGTGTAGSGNIIFQTAAAGTTGTAANTLTTRLTIASSGSITAAANISSTSTATGTVVVTGGVGISENLWVGGYINIDNLRLQDNTLSSTNTNGNIVLAPNGTGDVQLDADTVRIGDAGAAATLTTNGAGNLTLSTNEGTNSGTILINNGANGNIELTPDGTGDVYLNADTVRVGDSAAAATITSNGAGALTVTTGGAANLTLSTNSGTSSGTILINNGANGNIELTPNGTGDVYLNADTVRVGDSNANATITTNGTGDLILSTNAGTNSGDIIIFDGTNSNIELQVNGTGTVVINEDGNSADFRVESDTDTHALFVDGSANNVGIGTSTPGYKLEVNGSFAATTKSFVIDHPTKPGKKLRYGSLEGPENGVYLRGKLKGNVIELPEYWTKLVDPDSITVQLTPIGKHQKLYIEDIRENRVYVANDAMFGGEVHCFYYVLAERIDVEKLKIEVD